MLAPMSEKVESPSESGTAGGVGHPVRSEMALIMGIVTLTVFFGAGNRLVENTTHPLLLVGVFLWLFIVILWSAICVVRHADCLAIKFGEPYGP